MFRLALLICLTLALLAARLPAGLMDQLVSRLTDERLRVTSIEGSFWNGSGILSTSDGQHRVFAVRPIEWRFGVRTAPVALTLLLSEHGESKARLLLRPGGVQLERLDLELPLSLLAAATAHPLAKAGWQGRLRLQSPGLLCDWQRMCDGRLAVQWRDAALEIVPDRHLGDHEVVFHAVGDRIDVTIATLESDLRIDARGALDRSGRLTLEGSIEGDPDLVDRLPNVMDRIARASGTPGRTLISLP